VKNKTEEFLYMMLWSADMLFQPTFRNLTDSYEAWAYRGRLLRQVQTLKKLQLVEQTSGQFGDRLYRLTAKGRLHALGGRDPQARWARRWDGRWRLVLFDVPKKRDAHRVRLRRHLRARGFGCLQGSVWITPDPMEEEREVLSGESVNVNSLLLLEATPCAGESDEEIVAGAWNYELINRSYARHMKVLGEHPKGQLRNHSTARKLRDWATRERSAWLAAVNLDPLLPKRLLPPRYLGCLAWKRRIEVLRQAGEQMRRFRSNPD